MDLIKLVTIFVKILNLYKYNSYQENKVNNSSNSYYSS